MPDGCTAVYIGSDYKYLPREKTMELIAQLCIAVGDGNPDDSQLDHAVHAYKVASVARMAMETEPQGHPTVAVLNASIKEGVRAALAAAGAKDVQSAGDDKVLWGVVANAGRLSERRKARWAHVSDATGQGSNASAGLCQRFGFDPDEEIPGRPHQPEDANRG